MKIRIVERFTRLHIIVLILHLLWVSSAFAKEVLFSQFPNTIYNEKYSNQANLNYKSLSQLQPGDTLVLRWIEPQGLFGFKKKIRERRVRIGKFLGEGGATLVYELVDMPKRVLRLPNCGYLQTEFYPTSMLLDSMADGALPLIEAGVPITEIHEFQRRTYMIVDKAEGPTLNEFLMNPEQFSFEERKAMLEDLLRFARSTAVFLSIGDFGRDQIVFDKFRRNKWVLRDWSEGGFTQKQVFVKNKQKLYQGNIFGRAFFPDGQLSDAMQRDNRISEWKDAVKYLVDQAVENQRDILWRGGKRIDYTHPNIFSCRSLWLR